MAENVTSEIHTELDVGNLCISNIALLKSSNKSNLNDDALKELAAFGVQKLLTEIYKLPSHFQEHVPVAKLPEPIFNIPREKRLPKAKAETKWEKFAKEKGIQKRKRDKLVWDANSKDWKPRYGYRGINNQEDWLVEVPQNGDPNADYFAQQKEKKNEKIAKNDYQRMKNIAKASNVKVTNLESVDVADKHQLSRSVSAAKVATASLGRYTETLSRERPPKDKKKKRQFKPNIQDRTTEKNNYLDIFKSIEQKKSKLNVQEAVQRYINKPLKEGVSEEQKKSSMKKRKAKEGRHRKNTFRSKNKKFRRE